MNGNNDVYEIKEGIDGEFPEGKVSIGRWNTAGGKHPEWLCVRKCAGPAVIKEALEKYPYYKDELAFLEARGADLVIHTPQSRRGIWIGTNGWRIKRLQLVLGKGRVLFEDLFSIEDGRWTIINTSMGVLTTFNFGAGSSLCRELYDLMEPYKIGHTDRGCGDQRVGTSSYKAEVKKVIEKFVSDNKPRIIRALSKQKIEDWFFNPILNWEGMRRGDWNYSLAYYSKDERMMLGNIKNLLCSITELKKQLLEECEQKKLYFVFGNPELLDMLIEFILEIISKVPENLQELNSQIESLAIDVEKTIQDCRRCYNPEEKKYTETPKLIKSTEVEKK